MFPADSQPPYAIFEKTHTEYYRCKHTQRLSPSIQTLDGDFTDTEYTARSQELCSGWEVVQLQGRELAHSQQATSDTPRSQTARQPSSSLTS